MKTPEKFNPQQAVDAYRSIIARRDAETTVEGRAEYARILANLRNQWQRWQGEYTLHEMAFGQLVGGPNQSGPTGKVNVDRSTSPYL
jgi:hypothetical protein